MKSVEQYTQEIFQRSEMKQKEQKKRQQITVSLCTGVAAVTAALAIFINTLPDEDIVQNNFSADSAQKAENSVILESYSEQENNADDKDAALNTELPDKEENKAEIFVSLECASSEGKSSTYSTEYAKKAFNLINGFDFTLDMQNENSVTNDAPTDDIETEGKTYTLTFTVDESAQYIYYLKGDKLFDRTNGGYVSLNDEELTEIQLILGIK